MTEKDINIDNITGAEELGHLVKLLDDESDFVYTNVRDRFLSYGEKSSDFLKDYTRSDDPLVASRSKEIIEQINFERVDHKFAFLPFEESKSKLEDAALLLAEYGYPDLDTTHYRKVIDKMADDIETSLARKSFFKSSALDTINVINNYFFTEQGFKGNLDNFYDPDNTFINKVIDKKTGIPITLSLLYLLIGQRLNLPIYGVNLPQHFIVKYVDGKDEYFIDPFNSGIVVSKEEAMNFLKRLGMSRDEFNGLNFLQIAADREIIMRMIQNLINVYEEKDKIKAEQLKKFLSYFDN